MFLDPVKVTILTPGMDEQGNMDEEGIPAALVAKFLDERGVVVEKTGPTTCCSCSVSVSIKPGRWGCCAA
jgi:lysine decarboxylase